MSCEIDTRPTEPPLSFDAAAQLAAAFKALSDPLRLQMLAIIAAKPEVCVCEIMPAFQLTSGTVSHHLKTLREAGLVTSERRGTFVFYSAISERLNSLRMLLENVSNLANPEVSQRP